ncbi:DNA gyrase subunit B [Klebsiella oxytoca]|uniref:DNA gyrase subunit B n=1 Tax=Klebsiella oxytoca TaxID=571 RepID=UPI0019183F65|nr:DNA gyrase subunit B [Klebsiella oxytoca]HAT1590670.1 DNA gyrase subunit B [Klebsiella oxytoca]HBM2984775.1 DNA gyrase subunit B [Klebsiella oxytoca]HCD7239040.1 DNA gyrase subunit B [Klebsiella oxytoca]
MFTQELVKTFMLISEKQSRAKYEVFTGDHDYYAFITVYGNESGFHIKGYDSLKLDDSRDVRSQIEEHFAATYP